MNYGPKSKIVLLTGNSLCHNPRAMKEAQTLARAGHKVSVLGAWLDPEFKTRDLRLIGTIPFEFIPVLDFTLPGVSDKLARFARRAGKRRHPPRNTGRIGAEAANKRPGMVDLGSKVLSPKPAR